MKRGLAIVTFILGVVTAVIGVATSVLSMLNVNMDKKYMDQYILSDISIFTKKTSVCISGAGHIFLVYNFSKTK